MTPVAVRALVRETMKQVGLKVLQEDDKEWGDTITIQHVTENTATMSVHDIFSADKTANLGPKGEPPLQNSQQEQLEPLQDTPNVMPDAGYLPYPTLADTNQVLPPKRRGKPRKENFMTPK